MALENFQKQVKTAGMVVFLLVVLVGAIFFGQKVPGYLSQASSCPVQGTSTQQVTGNSAVVSWTTAESTQGTVQYGTASTSLSMSVPESAAATAHTVPLTLLTPNTTYYYVVNIGGTTCDSTGQQCTDSCLPWSFTTTAIQPQKEPVVTLPAASPSASMPNGPGKSEDLSGVGPTSSMSVFCAKIKDHIGESSKDASTWSTAKEYDVDNNGIINGKDIIKCNASGR